MPSPEHDALIIGAGATGFAAAVVLGRQRLKVAIVSTSRRRNSSAPSVHMLPPAEGRSPDELYARMTAEVESLGCRLVDTTATDVVLDTPAGITVHTEAGPFTGRRLLVATGVTDDVPDWVPPSLWGSTVFTCPFCHAYEHRDKDFLVVGKNEIALEVGLLCRPNAAALTVVVSQPDAGTSAVAERVRELGGTVIAGTVTTAKAVDDGALLATVSTGQTVRAGAVLASQLSRSAAPIVDTLGLARTPSGLPEVDDAGRTSNPLVYVAGNAARPHLLFAECMAGGVRAGMSMCKDHLL